MMPYSFSYQPIIYKFESPFAEFLSTFYILHLFSEFSSVYVYRLNQSPSKF